MIVNERNHSLYVGPDWVVYAGPDGYEHSEMIAPAALVGEPNSSISCTWCGANTVSGDLILHPAGLWSSCEATGVIVIYFDAASDPGRKIQSQDYVVAGDYDLLGPFGGQEFFNRLIDASVSKDDVSNFVSAVGRLIVGAAASGYDFRVKRISHFVSMNPVGRLSLSGLASVVKLSPDHLRHLFKKELGLTLSKYKAWWHVHSMLLHIVKSYDRSFDWRTGEAIKHAGFYDDAHGYRTLSQYFGPKSSLVFAELRLLDCTHSPNDDHTSSGKGS